MANKLLLTLFSLSTLIVLTTTQQYQQQYPQSQYNRGQYDQPDQYPSQQGQYYGPQNQQYTPPGQYGPQSQYPQNQGQFGNSGGAQGQQYPAQQGQQQYDTPVDPYNRKYDQQSSYGQPAAGGRDDNCCDEYCYAEDETRYYYFGTKTAYSFIYGKRLRDHVVPHCKPVQFWSINRHGTRFPSAVKIERMRQLQRIHDEVIRNYEERRSFPNKGRLCNEDFDLLKTWRWNDTITVNSANDLTRQGIDDMKYLARRTQTRFPEVLKVPYSDLHFHFQYTDTHRTQDSYQAYIEGLFNDRAYLVHASVQPDDLLIGADKTCAAWRRQVGENPATLSEYLKFKEGREFKELVRNVFRRLGFRYTGNASLVDDMYDMCRFEKAWYVNRPSPWCAAFTKDQLKLLEYAVDLEEYYYAGYGNEANKHIGCPPVRDLLQRLERTINGDALTQKVTVYFTHSTPYEAFLTALGIAQDAVPLRADNYYQQTQRQWRTSTLSPFAANLAVVLYRCDQGEQHQVMFFLNEQPVDLPGCSVGLCSWQYLRNKLKTIADTCNTAEYCERGGASATVVNGYFIALSLFVFVAVFNFK